MWPLKLKNALEFNDIELCDGLHVHMSEREGSTDADLLEMPGSLMHSTAPHDNALAMIIPPCVYSTLTRWYGGGPAVSRQVISTTSAFVRERIQGRHLPREAVRISSDNAPLSVPTQQEGQKCPTQLELFPLRLKLYGCDQTGTLPPGLEKRVLMTRNFTLNDLSRTLLQVGSSIADSLHKSDQMQKHALSCRFWRLSSHSIPISPESDTHAENIHREEFQEIIAMDSALSDVIGVDFDEDSKEWHPLLLEFAGSDGVWPMDSDPPSLPTLHRTCEDDAALAERVTSPPVSSSSPSSPGNHIKSKNDVKFVSVRQVSYLFERHFILSLPSLFY